MPRFLLPLFALLALVALPCSGKAPVEVTLSQDWDQATPEQMAALPKNPLIEYVDFSITQKMGGYAIISFAKEVGTTSKQYAKGALEGYISSITKAGHSNVVTRPGSFGKLRGFWVLSSGKSGTRSLNTASLMLFSKRDFYSITVCRFDEKITEESEITKSYLARVHFKDSVEPGNIDLDTESIAYKSGRLVGFFLTPVLLLLAVAALVIVVRRRLAAKVPPLP